VRRARTGRWAAAAALALLLLALGGLRPGAPGGGVAAAWARERERDRERVPSPFETEAEDSIRYQLRVTDNNQVGLTITNYGFVGNNFVSRSPSMEYPLGSGFEHLVRGGLWIGGIALDDTGAFFQDVVTGTLDGSQGSSSASATEFTPAGIEIKVRSTLRNNKFFNPAAVSELDYLGEFSDQPAKRALNNNEDHRPMNLLVRQENYAWSFSDFQHFVIFHYVIKNIGRPIHSLHVGFYSEMASGNKNLYSTWPPSSGSGPGSWYARKLMAYDDSLRMVREHYCSRLPVPANCAFEAVPYWAGVKILTPPDEALGQKVTMQAWDYAPGDAVRDEDVERYALMSAGTITDLSAMELQPESGDPVSMISIGPFHPISDPLVTGDSLVIDFAIIGASSKQPGDNSSPRLIHQYARTAQRAYDRNYDVPVPPPSPSFKVVARDGALDFYWDEFPEFEADSTGPVPLDFEGYRLYIGEDRLNLARVAQFDRADAGSPHDTTGFNTGFSAVRLDTPVTLEGQEYHYRYTVTGLRNGFKYFTAVTSYDLGNNEIESLESGISQNKALAIPGPAPGERPGDVTVYPNPYRVEARWDQSQLVRDHYLWFANLPEQCTLRIYTLSGDLVFETDFDGAGYRGEGTRGIYDPRRELDVPAPTLSGTSFGWNMITKEGQAVATGLYMYSVEAPGRDRQIGKFLIVKSDRED
jgi:hypothetical protein